MKGYNVYVISAGRYDKLPFTDKQKREYIFCVKDGEGSLYKEHGCENVYETGTLMDSRNFALNHAFDTGKVCVQLSDDIKKVVGNKNFIPDVETDLDDVLVEYCYKFDKATGVKLMGVPPTSNAFFAKSLLSKNTFCIGDMLFVKPCPLRFDTNLTLKEDYDYTLQHIKKYGICIRYQKYLFHFDHYSNSGGAVSYRTDQEEQKNIGYLKKKWGDKIRLNPKRSNEILI